MQQLNPLIKYCSLPHFQWWVVPLYTVIIAEMICFTLIITKSTKAIKQNGSASVSISNPHKAFSYLSVINKALEFMRCFSTWLLFLLEGSMWPPEGGSDWEDLIRGQNLCGGTPPLSDLILVDFFRSHLKDKTWNCQIHTTFRWDNREVIFTEY